MKKGAPSCLGYIGDYIYTTQLYMGITIKDPYEKQPVYGK